MQQELFWEDGIVTDKVAVRFLPWVRPSGSQHEATAEVSLEGSYLGQETDIRQSWTEVP